MSKTKVRPILGSAHLWFYAVVQLIGTPLFCKNHHYWMNCLPFPAKQTQNKSNTLWSETSMELEHSKFRAKLTLLMRNILSFMDIALGFAYIGQIMWSISRPLGKAINSQLSVKRNNAKTSSLNIHPFFKTEKRFNHPLVNKCELVYCIVGQFYPFSVTNAYKLCSSPGFFH